MELLTVQETAALLKVSEGTVRRHVAAGQLAAVRVGRLIRIRREAVEQFLEPVMPKPWKPLTPHDSLRNIVGIAAGDGPTDIARNHDHNLAGAYADLHKDDDLKPERLLGDE